MMCKDARWRSMDPVRDSAWLQAAMEVPVTASLGPMAAVLRQLHSEHCRPEGVSEAKIQRLLRCLGGLCITLKDLSDQVHEPSFTALCWMKEVRELCFDTQDYFDKVSPAASDNTARTVRARLSNIIWFHRRPHTEIARDFLELRARVVDARKRRRRLELGTTSSKPPETESGQAGVNHRGMPQLRTQLLEEPMDDIVRLLDFDDKKEKHLKVITIFGFAGVGKTTAANTMYHKHGWKFQCRAFLRVSRNPNTRRLLTSILSQIKAPSPPGFPDVQDLIDIIKTHLQGKRYLIILDNLWASSTWDIISCAFPHGDCRSRIITTTEIKDVALACSRPHLKHKYDMSPLKPEQSKQLFFSTVFGSGGHCPQEFKDVSDTIISKCGGLPLVIACVGSLLASKIDLVLGQWKQLSDSLPSSLMINPTHNGMKEFVNFMYNALPPYLKTCLLYLSMYPEGCIVWKDDLVNQWVAEDFIGAEENAGVYFDDLVSRGMVQAVNINCDGEVLSCTVHHMVLDLIRHKSMVQNFIVIVGTSPAIAGLPDKVRRLSVQFGSAKCANIPTGFRISQARSYVYFGYIDCVLSIEKYKLLRVLILHTWSDQDKDPLDLTRLGELFLLRYLKVQCNITVQLPEEMRRLQYLETLQVDAKIAAAPSDIFHLEKLLHLRLPSECVLPVGFARLTSLRTLGYFDLGSHSEDIVMDLAKLTNLKDIQLTCSTVQLAENQEKNVKLICSILENLRGLQSVILAPTTGFSPVKIPCIVSPPLALTLQRIQLSRRCCIFFSIPQWFGELRVLRVLTIAIRGLSMNDIDILKVLPSLTALTLYVQTAPAERITIKEGGFPVLTHFKFMCAAVPSLYFELGAMPHVQKLKLGFDLHKWNACSLKAAGFCYLTGLIEISVKFGTSHVDESSRKAAESALEVAIRKHPNTLIVRVQLVDVIFGGQGYKSMVTEETAIKEQEDMTPKKRRDIQQGMRKSTGRWEEHLNETVDTRSSSMEKNAQHEPSKLSFQFLKQITNDFDKDRILGSGGFGTVYKGVHENCGEMAVKVLRNISGLDDKEFRKEFNNLRGLKHPNIVELVGFCNESEEVFAMHEGKQVTAECLRMALCFEYVQKGSLNKHISDEKTGLTWHTRYRIIKGICEGLKYLREGLEYPIMHFDLKPDNILIDKSMTPKITDFGLSKLFGEENTRKTMSSVGTCGYWPPEYIKHQIISKEFDIFSLGVIILRIMTGHERYNSIVEMPTRKSVKLVHESWTKKLHGTLSRTSLEVCCNQVKRCIEIALNCLISNRHERPTIQDIVSSLNETETMIGDRGMQNEQFYQGVVESTLPSDVSSITINSRPSSENFLPVGPRMMSLHLLEKLTDGFSKDRLIGRGRYGTVYKGVNMNGDVSAVKMLLNTHEIDGEKFKNEIAILKELHHPNIVQCTGYCHETKWQVLRDKGKYILTERTYIVFCFEYFQSGSLERYISEDMDSGLDWQTRYGILKGMCEGLKYLHEGLESPIIHMDLKPSNILMDEKMIPKIGDFVSARHIGVHISGGGSASMVGTIGYMPPEFIEKQVISKEYDIFSLGVLTLELMTGRQLYRHEYHKMPPQEFIELAHEKWRGELQKTVDVTLVERNCQQVKKCLQIAVKCLEYDRHKRPAIGDIIHMLNETETNLIPLLQSDSEDSDLLLEVHPMELPFMSLLSEVPRKKKAATMSSSCSLQLRNKGNDRVAFMLVANSPKRYLTKEPLCGIVSPRCSYTLILTMRNNKQQPLSSLDGGGVDFFTLYSIGLAEYDLLNVDKDSISKKYDNFFKKAKEEVKQVRLNVVCDRPTSDQGTSSEIITTADAQQVLSIDVHSTEPWIMTANHMGSLRVWNYKTMTTLSSFELSAYEPVHVAKFITREKWLVAGDRHGAIFVYNYEDENIESFDAHDSCITTLDVHPTSPFVLSSSEDDDHLIKLWDWGNGWKCTREFAGHTGRVMRVTFNLENNDKFVSASFDGTVKVWSICSDDPRDIITLKLDEHGLCADYFTRDNRQHLIVGCKDRTAQIWELGMKGRVHELEGHEDHISAVSLPPELPVLITGSLDGTIRVWDSTTYKLEKIIGFNLGAVYAFECIKGTRRIVVGCHQGIATIEIPLP